MKKPTFLPWHYYGCRAIFIAVCVGWLFEAQRLVGQTGQREPYTANQILLSLLMFGVILWIAWMAGQEHQRAKDKWARILGDTQYLVGRRGVVTTITVNEDGMPVKELIVVGEQENSVFALPYVSNGGEIDPVQISKDLLD